VTNESTSVQQTLTGETTEMGRIRPETFMYIPETDMWILRSEQFQTEHEVVDPAEYFDSDTDDPTSPYDEFDRGEEVANYYRVTINRSVDYRFTVPAWSDARAKEIAEQWALDANPADAYTVHTRVTEQSSIERQDLPADWDPYGSEPVHEALERAEDGDYDE